MNEIPIYNPQQRDSLHRETNINSYLKHQQLNHNGSFDEPGSNENEKNQPEDVAKFIAQQYGENNILLEGDQPLKIMSDD